VLHHSEIGVLMKYTRNPGGPTAGFRSEHLCPPSHTFRDDT
jgi:hypothetical protein